MKATESEWTPCYNCLEKLQKSEKSKRFKIKENQNFFNGFRNSTEFELGLHGIAKAKEKSINLDLAEERKIASSGEIVEIQKGKFEGEFKFILWVQRNGEPLHYIFLKRPDVKHPTLVNVYNPTEGMSFKWSADGRKRLFLNSFRSCCPHPEDKEENYNKAHHGKQHGLYDYQKKQI